MKTKLTNGAGLLLKNALTAPGWAESIQNIFTAGKISSEKLASLNPEKVEDESWRKLSEEYEFSADEIAVIKTCFEKLAASKSLSANELTMELITSIGLM